MTQLDQGVGALPVRPEIERSWRRSARNGVDPATPDLTALPAAEIDAACRLMRAAEPVLEQMTDKLAGTAYSLLLADRDCRLMYRWFDDPELETMMDNLGIRTGVPIGEETAGTNALGTAFELREGIAVHGAEHFIEPFKSLTCYGHPIRNPVTRRLEGVLDITGTQADANPLLAPLLIRAVEDIEIRLLDQAKASERALLTAFQASAAHRARPVAALGEDMVLTNKAALDLLAPADHAVLRLLMEELGSAGQRSTEITLASGRDVRVQIARVPGGGEGTLFSFEAPTVPGRPAHTVSDTVCARTPVLVHGEPGTGRTTRAREIAPDADVFNCADAVLDGEARWTSRLASRLREPGTVRIEHLEHLPSALVPRLGQVLRSTEGPRIIVTSAPVDELPVGIGALASGITDRIECVPLRDRAHELADLADQMLCRVNPGADIRLVPSVIETLATRDWPGNLHELRAVVAHVAQRRPVGDVTVDDLPDDYRSAGSCRPLAGRERAERDAIISALQAEKGNKLRAAQDLGISRTTLYARMKALSIR